MSYFKNVPTYPPDPIFGINILFKDDPREKKANLSVGIYNDEKLFPKKMEVVKEAELLAIKKDDRAEYLPVFGYSPYIEGTGKLVLGDFWEKRRSHIFAMQGLGGTGSLRSMGDFFHQELPDSAIYLPDPTWPNHFQIFEKANLKVETYPYYDHENHRFAFDAMCQKLEKIPERSIVLLQASCHNPTGCDPTIEQWEELSKIMKRRSLIPHFDLAYQGMGRGVQEDARSIRLFAEMGHEMVVSVTHSKSFGLYNGRIGMDFIITEDEETANRVKTSVRTVVRANYSNPPLHPACTIGTILNSPTLFQKWVDEIDAMRNRIDKMQLAFAEELIRKTNKVDYSFLKGRVGLFAYTELSPEKTEMLMQEKAIYLPSNGRVNVTRINDEMIEYITDSIAEISDR